MIVWAITISEWMLSSALIMIWVINELKLIPGFYLIKKHCVGSTPGTHSSDFSRSGLHASTLNFFWVVAFLHEWIRISSHQQLAPSPAAKVFYQQLHCCIWAVEVKPRQILLFWPIAPHDRKFLSVSIHPRLSFKLGLLHKSSSRGQTKITAVKPIRLRFHWPVLPLASSRDCLESSLVHQLEPRDTFLHTFTSLLAITGLLIKPWEMQQWQPHPYDQSCGG